MSFAIKARTTDVTSGRPQVAMHCNCQLV